MKIDKIISIIRELKEEAMAAPTNSVGGGQIAGTKEAGDNPPVDLRKGKRRNWNPFFKDLVRRNRKKKKRG